jgi:hypothetical protein
VKLTLFLVPHHAGVLDLYWRSGLWAPIEQLKTELANLVASQGRDVVLWDFLEYSSFTAEPVPPAADRRTATQWFWEPNHFKKQLGRIMIERMLGEDAPAFGAVLTPGSVAGRNREVRAQRQAAMCAGAGGIRTSDLVSTDGCEAAAPGAVPPGAL